MLHFMNNKLSISNVWHKCEREESNRNLSEKHGEPDNAQCFEGIQMVWETVDINKNKLEEVSDLNFSNGTHPKWILHIGQNSISSSESFLYMHFLQTAWYNKNIRFVTKNYWYKQRKRISWIHHNLNEKEGKRHYLTLSFKDHPTVILVVKQ